LATEPKRNESSQHSTDLGLDTIWIDRCQARNLREPTSAPCFSRWLAGLIASGLSAFYPCRFAALIELKMTLARAANSELIAVL